MQSLDLSSLFDLALPLWAVGGVLVLFALYAFPLLLCALLGKGRIARNANRQLDRLFGLFHAMIERIGRR